MIISHKYRFIFIAIPKTGSQSIRHAIRPHLDENDWEQVELMHKSKIPIAAFNDWPHGHIKLTDLKEHLDSAQFESYFKFGFMRNPFDRFVSTCFFMYRNNKVFHQNPTAFMKLRFRDFDFLDNSVYMPQTSFLTNETGELTADFIGDFGHLQRDFNAITHQLGLPSHQLEKINESAHDQHTLYYDDELKALVHNYYAADIELYHSLSEKAHNH